MARAVISANGGGGGMGIPRPLGAGSEDEADAKAVGGAGAGAVASFKSHAELRKTEALLRDALDRCLRLEEARGVAEGMAGNVQETVTRLEQALMSEKMARKMKESQVRAWGGVVGRVFVNRRHMVRTAKYKMIHSLIPFIHPQIARLQKKAPAGEGSGTEAELRAEIEALRKEAEQA